MERMKLFVLLAASISILIAGSSACAEDKVPGMISGTVTETMNSGSYTYVQVDTGKEKVWAAAPQFSVKVGEKVSFSNEMPMKKFESKTLKRTFDTLYFVGKINTPGGQPSSSAHGMGEAPNDAVHASLRKSGAPTAPPANVNLSGIKKATGGLTVAEIYQQKAKLENKQVTFRGKVVKYNAQIMKKNWLHVEDGSGSAGSNDITVTTDDTAQVGDTVLVKGTVALNKDYGYGYKYDLVVENARVTVEPAKK